MSAALVSCWRFLEAFLACMVHCFTFLSLSIFIFHIIEEKFNFSNLFIHLLSSKMLSLKYFKYEICYVACRFCEAVSIRSANGVFCRFLEPLIIYKKEKWYKKYFPIPAIKGQLLTHIHYNIIFLFKAF